MRILPVVASFALLALSAGCVRNLRGGPASADYGTCGGACEHYTDCRGSSDPALMKGCLDECEAIFVTDGVVDSGALGEFEDLECHDAVAFVEGDSGRPPGGSAGGGPTAATATADRERR